MADETNNVQPPVRDELVETAIKFLQNPNVVNTPLAQKQKFLQRKGLTDQEIQLACEKSGAYNNYEVQSQIPPSASLFLNSPRHNSQNYPVHLSFFDRIKEVVHNIAIFSIVAYTLQKLYQRYIAPFLFGKKKSLEEAVAELDSNVKTSVDKIQTELESVKAEVHRCNNDTENSNKFFEEIKVELSSVKGLLLNRKQFPSVSNTPVVPPSIPAWQLSSVNPGVDQEEPKEDMLEELGSGSGSSEPEHGMKTSESSLEIIYSSRDYDTESCHSKKSGKEDDND